MAVTTRCFCCSCNDSLREARLMSFGRGTGEVVAGWHGAAAVGLRIKAGELVAGAILRAELAR